MGFGAGWRYGGDESSHRGAAAANVRGVNSENKVYTFCMGQMLIHHGGMETKQYGDEGSRSGAAAANARGVNSEYKVYTFGMGQLLIQHVGLKTKEGTVRRPSWPLRAAWPLSRHRLSVAVGVPWAEPWA